MLGVGAVACYLDAVATEVKAILDIVVLDNLDAVHHLNLAHLRRKERRKGEEEKGLAVRMSELCTAAAHPRQQPTSSTTTTYATLAQVVADLNSLVVVGEVDVDGEMRVCEAQAVLEAGGDASHHVVNVALESAHAGQLLAVAVPAAKEKCERWWA